MPPDRIGLVVRDFLDVHSALSREQDKRDPTGDIDQDGRIQLTLDRAALLDQDTLNAVVADRHTKYFSCGRSALLRLVRHLDATGLSSFAGRHLCLNDRGSDACDGRIDFLRRRANYSFWNWHRCG